MDSRSTVLLALAVVLASSLLEVEAAPTEPRTIVVQDAKLIRQFLDRYQPALLVHPVVRRFDIQPSEEADAALDDPVIALRRPAKRNNAEVVNHILKNFGSLDRLGDVGK